MSRSFALPTRRNVLRTSLAALLAALLLAVASRPAVAVNIEVSYDETDHPSFDPNGEKLMTMMAWVEAYYESLLTDMSPQWHPTYDIEVWWEDIPDGTGRLAETQINPFEVDIVFDTKLNGVERNWFFDETPIDNSEFNFADSFGTSSPFLTSGQNLFRDIAPELQQSGYSGSPLGVLEVGYQALANSGSPAVGMFDLWSTAIHEMGHVLEFQPELIDDDNNYEFYDFQHGGVDAALRESPDSDGHAASPFSLMCDGCGQAGVRRLPAAADLLALGRGIGLQNVNLQRVDFIGVQNSNYTDPLNWIGGQVPGTFDETFIRNSTPAIMTDGYNTARNLFVYEDSSLTLAGSAELKVYHELRVGNLANGTRGDVHVGNIVGNPYLEVESLNIDKGMVNMSSQGAILVSHGSLKVKPQGTLLGAGQVEVAGELNNDGEISAGTFMLLGFAGDLYLRAINNGKLDLDGGQELVNQPFPNALAPTAFPGQFNDEFGHISAVNGNLFVVSPLADSFNGTATIGAGRKMYFFQPWGFGGTLALKGGATAAKSALLSGAEIQFGGTTTVEGIGTIDAPLVTGHFTNVILRTGSRLNLLSHHIGPASAPRTYGGKFTLEAGSTLNVDLWGGSWDLMRTLKMGAGSTVMGDNVLNYGRIEGAGKFEVPQIENSGVVAPTGELSTTGGYGQSWMGKLEIDLGGLNQGVTYDVLRVAGDAFIAGGVEFTLAQGFMPAVGTKFEFLTAANVNGIFPSLEAWAPADVEFSGKLRYQPGKVLFEVTRANFAADFNADGIVDVQDMNAWITQLHAGGPGLNGEGDADHDYDVDGSDMLIVQRQLGLRWTPPTLGSGAGGGIGGGGVFGSVPEPSTGLLALAALGVLPWRRKR
jgi:hypothetical protein